MILRTIDQFGNESAVFLYENNENGEVFVQDTFHCEVVDESLDSVFGTNEQQVTIINKLSNQRETIANAIVDDIVSTRMGEMYDEEILDMFVNDFFAEEMEKIREIVDEKMMNDYLEEDNMTIKED